MNRTIRTTLAALAPPRRQSMRSVRSRLTTFVALIAVLAWSPINAKADAVLDWDLIAVNTLTTQSPFAQARYMAITQLAVFEAVNAITGDYEPYLGTVVAPAGASADAAAIAAAYRVLKNYFPLAATLDTSYAASLASIPDSTAKTDGIATGEAAAAQMIALRVGDGSSPPEFYLPESSDPGVWQTTPTCPAAGGVNFQWQNITPFGMFPSSPGSEIWFDRFMPRPPPALTSTRYAKDYAEVKAVGSVNSTERPQDRADVARFFAASSPTFCIQPGSKAARRRPRQIVVGECAGPGPAQYGHQRQPRRVVRGEVLLPVLAARDGDSRGGTGRQRENRPRPRLFTVHPHAVLSKLPVEPRGWEQQRGGDHEASVWCRRPRDNDGQPRRSGRNAALHHPQADHGRHRRRARLRGHPFSIRPGRWRAALDARSLLSSTSTICEARTVPIDRRPVDYRRLRIRAARRAYRDPNATSRIAASAWLQSPSPLLCQERHRDSSRCRSTLFSPCRALRRHSLVGGRDK